MRFSAAGRRRSRRVEGTEGPWDVENLAASGMQRLPENLERCPNPPGLKPSRSPVGWQRGRSSRCGQAVTWLRNAPINVSGLSLGAAEGAAASERSEQKPGAPAGLSALPLLFLGGWELSFCPILLRWILPLARFPTSPARPLTLVVLTLSRQLLLANTQPSGRASSCQRQPPPPNHHG